MLTQDPIGLAGGVNLYSYAGSNPIAFSDPFGLCPKSAGGNGATDRFDDCPPGSSGWYAHRLATGEGNATLNKVGGVLASCGESWLCQGTLMVASLGASLLEGAGTKAATTAATSTGTEATVTAATRVPGAIGEITGFTKHGINQIIQRGVNPENILQAVKNAAPQRLVDAAGRVSYRYVGEKATVVLNEAGRVFTAW